MVTRIQIEVAPDRLAKNPIKRKRMARTNRFQSTDRVPVMFNYTVSGILRERNVRISEYFESAETQLYHQIMNAKWRIEHLHDDALVPTRSLHVSPDLQCVRAGYFPVEVHWQDDELPKSMPMLNDPKDINTLPDPEPHENLYGRNIDWYRRMQACSESYHVTVGGKNLDIAVSLGAPGGPIPDAFALAGEKLFLWMLEEPEWVHKLLAKVTRARIRYESYVRKLTGRSGNGIGMGCDTGELLSEAHYREFVVPYYLQVYEAFKGTRGLHMCGKINHLLKIIMDELKIDSLNGFGFVTDKEKLKATMGGRVIMSGGPNPMRVQNGSRKEVLDASTSYIETFRSCGGFTLTTGGGVPPGTAVERVAWMLEASRRAGAISPTENLASISY